jgi:uncharacterized membrane protein
MNAPPKPKRTRLGNALFRMTFWIAFFFILVGVLVLIAGLMRGELLGAISAFAVLGLLPAAVCVAIGYAVLRILAGGD